MSHLASLSSLLPLSSSSTQTMVTVAELVQCLQGIVQSLSDIDPGTCVTEIESTNRVAQGLQTLYHSLQPVFGQASSEAILKGATRVVASKKSNASSKSQDTQGKKPYSLTVIKRIPKISTNLGDWLETAKKDPPTFWRSAESKERLWVGSEQEILGHAYDVYKHQKETHRWNTIRLRFLATFFYLAVCQYQIRGTGANMSRHANGRLWRIIHRSSKTKPKEEEFESLLTEGKSYHRICTSLDQGKRSSVYGSLFLLPTIDEKM